MRRTNIHLTQEQIDVLTRIANAKSISMAEFVRRIIDFYLSFYDPNGPLAEIEFIRQKEIEKRGGADVTYEDVVLWLAHEKAIEYYNKQNNSARITTLVEEVRLLRQVIEDKLEAKDVPDKT